MTLKIVHKRSVDVTGGVSDTPAPTDLEYGEIAINYADVDPALFIRDSADVVRRLTIDGTPNKKYSVANDDTGLVGGDATTAINAALIANGDITAAGDLGISDQCEITDSGNPDFNADVPVGQYLWDGTVWFVGGGGANVTIAATAPTNGREGDLWWNSTEERLYVFYDDGSNPDWVVATPTIPEAPIDGNQYARQDGGWSQVTGGGGGIEYNGASAWGYVAGGLLANGMNIASVTNPSAGIYDIVFATPMPDGNYSTQVTVISNSNSSTTASNNQTATGFQVKTRDSITGALINRTFTVVVHAINALPPTGGTGIDAWASTSGDSTLLASFNIASVTKSGTSGRYVYTFTTPMPNINYGVQATSNSTSQPKAGAYVYSKATTGFSVQTYIGSSGIDAAHAISVNATNATLPATLTQDMIVMKAGDTMTGDLKFNDGSTNNIILEASTGAATFTGVAKSQGNQFTGRSGTFSHDWNPGSGGRLSTYVDITPFNMAYCATNNITLTWGNSTISGVVDGALSVVLGTSSDYRLKENVRESLYGTDAIKKLRPVTYDLIEENTTHTGFIAHEADEAIPGSASGEKDGELMQSINTYPIVAALTKALQEAIERIEVLEAQVKGMQPE